MTTRRRFTTVLALAAAAMTSLALSAAKDIPAQLPDPDGKPGDATKPVKVYILAGQSNMVGMGDLTGARNIYAGVYLTPDPAAPKGPLPIWRVGNYKIAPLAVTLPDGTPTDKPVEVTLRPSLPIESVRKVRMDESEEYDLLPKEGRGWLLPLRGGEIATIRLAP